MNTWGKELIVDAGECNEASIRIASNIAEFLYVLVKRIDMVPYGEPIIVRFGSGDKEGYTAIQLIETSNICCHFSEDTNSMYLNCFSCKDFDETVVISLVKEFFDNKTINYKVIERQAP